MIDETRFITKPGFKWLAVLCSEDSILWAGEPVEGFRQGSDEIVFWEPNCGRRRKGENLDQGCQDSCNNLGLV